MEHFLRYYFPFFANDLNIIDKNKNSIYVSYSSKKKKRNPRKCERQVTFRHLIFCILIRTNFLLKIAKCNFTVDIV